MKYHKLAEYFPILEGDEFEQLKQDIKDNGQLEPIVIYEDSILDGVNRWRAIDELNKTNNTNIQVKTKAYKGNDPRSFVISANIKRRHLNPGQIGVIINELIEVDFSQEKITDQVDNLSREFGVSTQTIHRARRIKKQAPEKIPEIISGKTTVRAVDTELRQKRAEEKRKAKQDKADLNERRGNPHEVKEYYDALKMYKAYLKVHKGEVEKAIKVARFGKFPPEAKNFTQNKHSGLIDMMNEIQDLYDELERSI